MLDMEEKTSEVWNAYKFPENYCLEMSERPYLHGILRKSDPKLGQQRGVKMSQL